MKRLVMWAKRQVDLWTPFREIKRPKFPVNDELKARADAIRLRERLTDPKPVYVESQPDYRERRPIDFDELPTG